MNSTKKVLKGNVKSQPKKQADPGSKKGVILAGILALLLVIMSGYIAWENLHPKLILTVNGNKTYLEDMTYQIMQSEQMHNSIASLYQQMGYAQSYWSMEDNGVTTQESVREEIVNNEIEQQILYAEAIKNGYEATEEEKEEAKTSAKEALENMSEDQKKKTGFTETELAEIMLEEAVALRYRQDLIDGFDIDDEKIRAGVDREQYREYKTQCFYVSTEADEEGKELSEAQKEERKNSLIKEAEAAKNTDDWSTVLDDKKEDQIVSYQAINFIKEDESYDAAVMKKAMTMENGEISDVVEGEDGYYIIKMVENNSADRYEEEVTNAIEEVENQKFEEEYLSIYENYEVTINSKEWNKVELGNLTM